MEDKVFEAIAEMIESRGYLLGFQKETLLMDMEFVDMDMEPMEVIIDRIFYKLFGKGWNDLSTFEQQDIELAWRGR